MTAPLRDLGDYLVSANKLSRADLKRVQSVQGGGDPLGALLVKMGLISQNDLASAQADRLSLPLIEKQNFPDTSVLDEVLSYKYLRHNLVLPLAADDRQLTVAVVDPDNDAIRQALRMLTGLEVNICVAMEGDIREAIESLYGQGRGQMGRIIDDVAQDDQPARPEDIAHLKDLASEAPVIRMVNLILQHAVEQRASDIHIEPFSEQLKVRYRIDGVLHEVESPPRQLYAALVSRVKIMANLDIAERRLPQDGRLRTRLLGRDIDLRVSTVPTVFGESLVMRLLYKENQVLDFTSLGFEFDQVGLISSLLSLPHGILLVTGPTGSGKTTTLYAALNQLNDATRKILTVEDPVEYQLDGVNQIQVKPQIGLSFAHALRSIVRQDPDVILIGEMRDRETADIAVQSALTGHLVLSTLHTNDAVSSITRLQDMGIPGYLLNSVLNGIVAQRLVRRLCPHCRQPHEVSAEVLRDTGLDRIAADRNAVLYRPAGCDACNGSGFSGRIALIEILRLSDSLRPLVLRQADAHELRQAAVAEGMVPLYEDGLRKALAGVTSLEEVLRVTQF